MIEGTRQYKNKGAANTPASSTTNGSTKTPQQSEPALPLEEKSDDAVNLERRAWFQALVPAFGEGLVKILRVSNNLQRDLHEALKAKTESIGRPEEPGSGKEREA